MLYGRETELVEIDRLLAGARQGRSGALLIQGEPGIGKSMLLDHAARQADGMRVLRCVGSEAEAELAFAGLHLLLRPFLDRLDAMPPPQARALRGALGLAETGAETGAESGAESRAVTGAVTGGGDRGRRPVPGRFGGAFPAGRPRRAATGAVPGR